MKISFLRSLFLAAVFVFFGCSIRSTDFMSKEEYFSMVSGSFRDIGDVAKLFPKSVSDIENRIKLAIEDASKSIDSIIKIENSSKTFENTARALDEASRRFSIINRGIHLVKSVSTDKSLRDKSSSALLEMNNFFVDKFLSVDLYNAFKSYVDNNAAQEDLNSEERYFLSETIKDFERAGLHLSKEKLDEVKKLQKEITNCSLEFSKNVAEDKSSITVDESDLKGVSPVLIKGLKKDSSGKLIVTCDYPTYFGVIKHCSVGPTRRDLSRAFCNRAYPANKPILEKIILKRDALASLLGFASYSDYDVDDQMAKEVVVAEKFIKDLHVKVGPKEQAEFEMLRNDLPVGIVLRDGKFEPWDFLYTIESYKKKHFDIDARKIAEYFPLEKTLSGVFEIYQKFLGLKFDISQPPDFWHEDVLVIKVYKKNSSNVDGYLLLDLHPRDGKYNHACCSSVVFPIFPEEGKKISPSVTAVLANFPKPTQDRPSLLKHSDVETFFHEFGHAMHNLLGRTRMNSFAGYSTKVDFVEVPSQMFEEWMWDKEMLKNISSHYKTGKPLPEDTIDKMIALKNLTRGDWIQRQCYLSILSLEYFSKGANKDVDKIMRNLYLKMRKRIHYDDSTHYYSAFGHLRSYGAKYYSYMWSLAYALDLFSEVKKRGLLNESFGKKLVDKVLSKGGSVDPNILLKDFLGRESSIDALLKDIGV
jgi:thimet oligopeptidase